MGTTFLGKIKLNKCFPVFLFNSNGFLLYTGVLYSSSQCVYVFLPECVLASVCLKQRCGESWLRFSSQLLSPPLVIKFGEFTWNFHNALRAPLIPHIQMFLMLYISTVTRKEWHGNNDNWPDLKLEIPVAWYI